MDHYRWIMHSWRARFITCFSSSMTRSRLLVVDAIHSIEYRHEWSVFLLLLSDCCSPQRRASWCNRLRLHHCYRNQSRSSLVSSPLAHHASLFLLQPFLSQALLQPIPIQTSRSLVHASATPSSLFIIELPNGRTGSCSVPPITLSTRNSPASRSDWHADDPRALRRCRDHCGIWHVDVSLAFFPHRSRGAEGGCPLSDRFGDNCREVSLFHHHRHNRECSEGMERRIPITLHSP